MDEYDTTIIVDHLKIEASSDNFVSSIETLVTVGEEVHEGWNYYDLTESGTKDPSKYQYYRLISDSPSKGFDNIGEINYIGYEVIDNTDDSYACDIEIVEIATDADGVRTESVTKRAETVTYAVA